MASFSRLLTAACVLLVLASMGCGRSAGPRRVAVRGAILFNSQPLKAGRISFTPCDNTRGPTAVATVADGFYDFNVVNGPIVGKHKVQIESILEPGFELDDEAAYAKAVQKQGGGPVLPQQPVPAEYNKQSRLVVTVSPDGEKKFDFSL